jgi:hypothetical protein
MRASSMLLPWITCGTGVTCGMIGVVVLTRPVSLLVLRVFTSPHIVSAVRGTTRFARSPLGRSASGLPKQEQRAYLSRRCVTAKP